MKSKDNNLINRIYQDAEIGKLSIDKVLRKVERPDLKKMLVKQYDMYDHFSTDCEAFALENEGTLKDNGLFKTIKMTASIYIALWADKSPRHVVELMINGTNMGIVDTIKAEKDLETDNLKLKELVSNFKKLQEDFYEKLKKILIKV